MAVRIVKAHLIRIGRRQTVPQKMRGLENGGLVRHGAKRLRGLLPDTARLGAAGSQA